MTLNCSFTGDRSKTTVYWMKGNLNWTANTTIANNNSAILSLFIDANSDMHKYLGSYQCVVTNKFGYISRTSRILPKGNVYMCMQYSSFSYSTGWASPPRNFKAAIEYHSIENCSIIVSWDPPVYNGGLPVHCYRLVVSYSEE